MKMNYKKGFTLIELLVVIAIIGILSAVVMASLGDARNKGADTATISTLTNIKTIAVQFSNENAGFTYTGLFNSGTRGKEAIDSAAKNSGSAAIYGVNADGSTWGAMAKLKKGGYYCVDSAEKAATTSATALTATTYLCNIQP